MQNYETKTAFVALVGRPNVGKSTLLNNIIGEKVSIVSDKPQTTRNRITGVITKDETQLIFLDTPGWHKAKNRLGDYMIKQVKDSLSGIELAVLLTEPTGGIRPEERELMENITLRNIPVILVINKIDSLDQKELMIPKIQAFSSDYDIDEVIPLSAKTGEGVDILMEKIATYAKPGPHYFDKDDYTDQPERVLVAEIIREKLLLNLRDELPHGIAIDIELMKERPEKDLIDINATIICERDTHKGMIIGKHGTMLKKVGSEARKDMENLLDCKVNLQCWVKVKKDWRNREGLIKEFGFDS